MAKPGKTGIARVISAWGYSWAGLKAAFRHEAAFRQELILSVVLIPAAFWIGNGHVETILLVASVVLVLIAELINSAIEAVVDRVGNEFHELSGRAKDIGSAIVLVSIGLMLFIWAAIVCQGRFA